MLGKLDQKWERIFITESVQIIAVGLAFALHWVQMASERENLRLPDLSGENAPLCAARSNLCIYTWALVLWSISQSTSNFGIFHLHHMEN